MIKFEAPRYKPIYQQLLQDLEDLENDVDWPELLPLLRVELGESARSVRVFFSRLLLASNIMSSISAGLDEEEVVEELEVPAVEAVVEKPKRRIVLPKRAVAAEVDAPSQDPTAPGE